ncbi:MAG: Hsp20/alpha crystallin family protein [Chitinophagales bacterium]
MGNLIRTERKPLGLQSIFDELFNNETFNTPKANTGNTTPAVNIRENENGFFLDFALPGVSKDQVVIKLDNDKLTVSSEKKENKEEKTENFTRREFHFNSFKRSFVLPETIDVSKIKANHNDGILSIEIPKKEEAKPKPVRQIEIA